MHSLNEYETIRKAIDLYIEAGKEAKSDIMAPVFHKNAIMYGSTGKKIFGGPIQGLFDHIDGGAKAAEMKAEITAIEIAGTIAYVRVESDNWNGVRYSDMFLLLKDEGGWKIITKVYHAHK